MKLWTIIDLDELAKLEYHGYVRARKSKISPLLEKYFNEKKAFILDSKRPDFRTLRYEYDLEDEVVLLELEVEKDYVHSMRKDSFIEKIKDSFIKGEKGRVYFSDKIHFDEVVNWKIYQGGV